MSHTPGPWRFIVRSEVSGIPSEDSTIPFAIERPLGSCVEPIADICNFPPSTAAHTKRQRANAKLIAAAPELLDAIQELVRIIDPPTKSKYDKLEPFFVGPVAAARKAIVKATL